MINKRPANKFNKLLTEQFRLKLNSTIKGQVFSSLDHIFFLMCHIKEHIKAFKNGNNRF